MTRVLQRWVRRRGRHAQIARVLALALLLTGMQPACGDGRAGSDGGHRQIRVGLLPWLTNAGILIAVEEGYFADAGLEVVPVRLSGGNSGTPLLGTGELDVIAGPASPGILNMIARGGGIRIVADKAYIPSRDSSECTSWAVVVRRDADSMDAAAGRQPALRRVRRTDTAGLEYFLDVAFAIAGIDTTGIEFFRVASNAATLDAMDSGAMDATSTAEPVLTRLLDAGHAVLWDARDYTPGLPFGFILYGPGLLQQDREAGVRFMEAYLRGVRQYREGKTERNIELLARAMGEEPELLQRACWPTIRWNGWLDTAAMPAFQAWALRRGYLDRVVAASEYWDPWFVEQALRRLDGTHP